MISRVARGEYKYFSPCQTDHEQKEAWRLCLSPMFGRELLPCTNRLPYYNGAPNGTRTRIRLLHTFNRDWWGLASAEQYFFTTTLQREDHADFKVGDQHKGRTPRSCVLFQEGMGIFNSSELSRYRVAYDRYY